jgi:hypothetical protein
LTDLTLLRAVGAKLLALGLPVLGLLDAVLAGLLALGPRLLTLDPRRTLLALDPCLTLDPRRTLLALDPCLTFDLRRTLPFDPCLAFDPCLTRLALSPHLLTLDARRLLAHGLLTLHSRRLLARLLPFGSLRAPVGLILVWPRQCRGCDRQRGDSRGEKYPGHRKFSFRTARTVRSTHRSNH